MARLTGRVAIVTGAAQGIGLASSRALAAEGATVAVVDLDGAAAADAAEQIRASGGAASGYAADVSDEASVRAVVARVCQDHGDVTVLVNNAGITRRTTAVETSVEDWDLVFAVNVRGVFLMCKHVVPVMDRAGGGSIVNMGSGWGLTGGARALPYCASKGAVVNMTRALAIDHGPQNIRVNSVNPGDTDTGMLRDEARQLDEDSSAFLREAAQRPLGRVGTPAEIASAVVWLASEESSFVTGSALVVDGGGIA